MKTSSNEIRSAFLNYFQKRQHEIVPSSSLIPDNDPTLLFTNAGMNQFKGVFLGSDSRPYSRATSSQKCVRAGGKHNDLDNVGHTGRHHTFFEMLGNFSFGDYFKKEAIHFSWELITREFQLPLDRLYISVFNQDDEAADIWHRQEGVPKERIYRFGEKDNFWRMGDTGPCGPSSEIFYDLGPEVGGDPRQNIMGGSGDRYMEIWNLVFMQYNESDQGSLIPLPRPSIDTGSGLERLVTVMQGQINNYHTDQFQTLIQRAMQISNKEYFFPQQLNQLKQSERSLHENHNVSLRVVADHSRAAAFLLSDGVLPSNEGRGYVLRRILRRGIRYAQKLTPDQSLMVPVVQEVINQMSEAYPDLKKQEKFILSTLSEEETRFTLTLQQGTEILNDALKRIQTKGEKILSGEIIFKLYDTFGFPLDLTRLMAAEQGLSLDEENFSHRMTAAREIAKASWKVQRSSEQQDQLNSQTKKIKEAKGPTKFIGYQNNLQCHGHVLLLFKDDAPAPSLSKGDHGILALDTTCFYAESGGQMGDQGLLKGPHGQAQVLDTIKINDVHLLQVEVLQGKIRSTDDLHQQVTTETRQATAAHHSATHLLHAALRKILGDHVRQAGSHVEADRLRFDFSHPKALGEEDILRIETLVNQEISQAHEVQTKIMTPQEATSQGAMALFGEKYGDQVRVVQMGGFSLELCGGTHVSNTSLIRLFKIVSEGSVSSGVRRIEALTGSTAFQYVLKHTRENIKARQMAGLSTSQDLGSWIEFQKDEIRKLQKQIQELKGHQFDIESLLKQSISLQVKNITAQLLLADLPLDDRQIMSDLGDRILHKMKSGIVVLMGRGNESHPLQISVSKNLTESVHAGNLLKEMALIMGGKGGGRPDFAQGAIRDRSQLNQAFEQAKKNLFSMLS